MLGVPGTPYEKKGSHMLRRLASLMLVCVSTATLSAQGDKLRADCGGWEPPPKILAQAVALKGLDSEALTAAVRKLEERGGASLRILVCRAGLRLADEEAALACASRLKCDELDSWETERVVSLCLRDNEYARPGTPVDFWTVLPMLGTKDLSRILANFPTCPNDWRTRCYLRSLRQSGSEHIPALAPLCSRPEPDVRRVTWRRMHEVAVNSDQHLDLVLRTSLAMRGLSIPRGPRRALRPDEWCPALRFIVFQVWPSAAGKIDPVERRAVLTHRPWPEDEAALRNLTARALAADGGSPLGKRWDLLLRSLRHYRSPDTLSFLRRIANAGERATKQAWTAGQLALAALAGQGDAAARARLAAEAVTHVEALARWFEVEPRAAWARFERQLLGGTVARSEAALSAWKYGLFDARHALLLSWPERPFEGLAARAAASPARGLTLLGIANEIPGCVTRRLVATAVQRIRPGEIRAMAREDRGEDTILERLAVAEVCAPEQLRARLRPWLEENDPVIRRIAHLVLLSIGDPASGRELAAWAAQDPEMPYSFGIDPLVYLSRSPCPQVESFVQAGARRAFAAKDGDSDFFAYLAMLRGMPADTASEMGSEPRSEAKYAEFCRRMLAGRIDACFRSWLDTTSGVPDDIWRVDRPEVRSFLRRLQNKRARAGYIAPTIMLACMGDDAARRETNAMLRSGRRDWMYESTEHPALATLGFDLKRMVPLWIDELETGSDRRAGAHNLLDDLFDDSCGLHLGSFEDGWATRASIMRRWWRQHRGAKFVWSRLGRRCIPVMPD